MPKRNDIVKQKIIQQLENSIDQAKWIVQNVRYPKNILLNELSQAVSLAEILKYIEEKDVNGD